MNKTDSKTKLIIFILAAFQFINAIKSWKANGLRGLNLLLGLIEKRGGLDLMLAYAHVFDTTWYNALQEYLFIGRRHSLPYCDSEITQIIEVKMSDGHLSSDRDWKFANWPDLIFLSIPPWIQSHCASLFSVKKL